MSYCLQSIPRATVQRDVTQPARMTETKAHADGVGPHARGLAHAVETEPSFIRAIARELSKTDGGEPAGHLTRARQLLEEAFRAIEQVNPVSDRKPSPQAA